MWQWVILKSTGSSNESTENCVLAFKGRQLRDGSHSLYFEATNRHGCWVEACCENTNESLHWCCLSKLFCQLLFRRSCLLRDRDLHLSIDFRAEVYILYICIYM